MPADTPNTARPFVPSPAVSFSEDFRTPASRAWRLFVLCSAGVRKPSNKRSLGWGRLCHQFMGHLRVSGAYSRSQQERSLPIVGIPLDSGPDRRAHSTQSIDPPSFGSHGARRSPRRSTADKGTRYDRKQTETRFAWQASRGVRAQRQQQDALLPSELLVLATVIVIFWWLFLIAQCRMIPKSRDSATNCAWKFVSSSVRKCAN